MTEWIVASLNTDGRDPDLYRLFGPEQPDGSREIIVEGRMTKRNALLIAGALNALELIAEPMAHDAQAIARVALGRPEDWPLEAETPGKQEQPVNIASQEPPTAPRIDP